MAGISGVPNFLLKPTAGAGPPGPLPPRPNASQPMLRSTSSLLMGSEQKSNPLFHQQYSAPGSCHSRLIYTRLSLSPVAVFSGAEVLTVQRCTLLLLFSCFKTFFCLIPLSELLISACASFSVRSHKRRFRSWCFLRSPRPSRRLRWTWRTS